MKRIAIYFFYDKDGIVDRYVGTVLHELNKNVERLIVVSNGMLAEESEAFIRNYTSEVIMRENKGFDVWAYKTVMDKLGWEELLKYDEIILMNYTIMGPVYPLEKVFSEMDKRVELDFWGITKCFREDSLQAQELWKNPYGYIPEHIQSSFTVFRKTLVSSSIFRQYWDNIPPILSYYESGGKHEQVITKYFADSGYKWDCYTQYKDKDYEYYGCYPLIIFPLEIVKGKKTPFFKRSSFFTTKKENAVALPKAFELLQFLKNETSYDISLIFENLIRTCNQRDLVESLMLAHIGVDNEYGKVNIVQKRIAIFAKIDTVIESNLFLKRLKAFDNIADIFVNQDGSEACTLNSLYTGGKKLDSREIPDYKNYDYILVINPFKQELNEAGTIYNIRQSYYIFNFLNNKESLIRAIKILENNKFEGMLTTPLDYMKSYHWEHYEQWSDAKQGIEEWKKRNDINVLTDVSKPPVRAENGVFLIKCDALTGIENITWNNYSTEFVSYAIPLLVQNNGYLPAYYTDVPRMVHNVFGYESYADWLPDLRLIKDKYYMERAEYIDLCEKNLADQHKYIQECEHNINLQQSYIQKCEVNIRWQQNHIQKCEADIRKQQSHIQKYETDIGLHQGYIQKCEADIRWQQEIIQEKEIQIDSIINSKWWKVGKFFKIIKGD